MNIVTGVGTPCSWTAEYIAAAEAPNGNVSDTANSPIPAGTLGVVVHVSRQPRTYFLGMLGQSSWQVAADATAVTYKPTTAATRSLLPIGTNPPNPFVSGQSYVLTDNAPYGPGAFGWLSWTGANATGVLSNSICNSDNPAMDNDVKLLEHEWARIVYQVKDHDQQLDQIDALNKEAATFVQRSGGA